MLEQLPLAVCPVCGGPWTQTEEITLQHDHIYFRGRLVKISKMESKILSLLVKRKGALIPTDAIHDFLYSDRPDGGPLFNTLSVYISHIRSAIKAYRMPYTIETVYQRGWVLYDYPKQ